LICHLGDEIMGTDLSLLKNTGILLPDGERNDYPSVKKFSTAKWLAVEFHALGFTTKIIGKSYLIATREGKMCCAVETETSFISPVARRLVLRKDYTRELLVSEGLHVPEGYVYRRSQKKQALKRLKAMGSAVLKPVDGQKGRGVSVGVTPEQFEVAWAAAVASTRRGVLLERQAIGSEARYLVVDGSCVAVVGRIPPIVFGDGVSTIRELLNERNNRRRLNPNLGHRPILIDAHREAILRSQGYDLGSIPAPDERVIIDLKAGISTGADSQNLTDRVHPSMKAVAERVAAAIPGLDVVGVDIISEDHCAPAQSGRYAIIEANSKPGIGGHLFPAYGTPVNVCRYIAESCARRMGLEVRIDSNTERMGAAPDRLAKVGSEPSSNPSEKRILIVGDIGFGEAFMDHPRAGNLRALLEENGYDYSLQRMGALLQASDLTVGNLETPLAPRPSRNLIGKKKFLMWCDGAKTADILQRAGFGALSIGNNHILDCGETGLYCTLDLLAANGITPFGAGRDLAYARRPFVASLDFGRSVRTLVVFAGFEDRKAYDERYRWYAGPSQPGVARLNTAWLRETISELRRTVPNPLFVVYPHWGKDYTEVNNSQRKLAREFIAAGADLVVGHGAHIAQAIEIIDGRIVVYGLGNFVFNSPGGFLRHRAPPFGLAAMLQLSALSSDADSLRIYPTLVDNSITNFQSRLVSDSEFEAIYHRLVSSENRFSWRTGTGRDEIGLFMELPVRSQPPHLRPAQAEMDAVEAA
jgi:D-alanine-D-alanine ligase-like ATP-grasp enzyme